MSLYRERISEMDKILIIEGKNKIISTSYSNNLLFKASNNRK